MNLKTNYLCIVSSLIMSKTKYGRMAELVDAQDSKSCGSNIVRVRFSLCPPTSNEIK